MLSASFINFFSLIQKTSSTLAITRLFIIIVIIIIIIVITVIFCFIFYIKFSNRKYWQMTETFFSWNV